MDVAMKRSLESANLRSRPLAAHLGTPMAMLILATMLFALGPAVLKLLTTRGAVLGLSAGGISFCNVLFVGNFCAGLVTLLFTGPAAIARELCSLRATSWIWLLLAAAISAIYPALLFTALERTTVTNVVLLSRLNGVVYVLVAFLVFRDRIRLPDAIGYLIIAAGVGVLIFADGRGLGDGDLLVLLATPLFAVTEIVSRKALPHVSVSTYVFFRNFVSAVIFFIFGLWLFGPMHFMDAFGGGVWALMALYALFAIVLAQGLWLNAIPVLPAKAVANTQLLNPAFSIAFALVLLGEVPALMQWTVIAIVAFGVLLPRVWRRPLASQPLPPNLGIGLVGK